MLLKKALCFYDSILFISKNEIIRDFVAEGLFQDRNAYLLLKYISESLVYLGKVIKNWFTKKTIWGTKIIHRQEIRVACEDSLK